MQQKANFSYHMPLRLLLIGPFLIQIVLAVAITGWLSYQTGQRGIRTLAEELLIQSKSRVKERLDSLFHQGQSITQNNTLSYQFTTLDRELLLQDYFRQQVKQNQSKIASIYVGDQRGRFLSVSKNDMVTTVDRLSTQGRSFYPLDAQGNRLAASSQDQFDPRQQPWYQAAIQNPTQQGWTPTHLKGAPVVSFSQAIRDATGRVIGVAGVDVSLADITASLQEIRLRRSSQIFVLERSGVLVADTSSEKSIDAKTLAVNSSSGIVRASAQELKNSMGKFTELDATKNFDLQVNGERYFLTVQPYTLNGGIEWLVAIVVSEREFYQQAEDNQRTTLLLSVLSLFITTAVGILTSQPITSTVSRLTKAANALASGKWEKQTFNDVGSREMNSLVNSFDYMVDRLHEVFSQLENFAYVDNLTGLPNRASLHLYIEQALGEIQQASSPTFAVFMFDIDSFELIENGLGQATAEALLKNVAARLQTCLHDYPHKAIARLEADEFVVLIKQIHDSAQAAAIAQLILQEFQQPFHLGAQDVLATVSIGVVLGSTDYQQSQDLLRDANLAKFSAKTQGRSSYTLFDNLIRIATTEHLQLKTDLQYAIEREELVLWYQPIVAVHPDRIIGVEALVRWQHPQAGLISPSKFILLAEETEAIINLGMWAIQAACQQTRTWQETALQFRSIYVSVNVSAKQLLVSDFVEHVEQILNETGLAGCFLQLEITESTAVSQPEVIGQKLAHLRSLGVRICIDDFGTGYSHLSHLLQLPVDVLKIDRSFVTQIGSNDKTSEIARTIIALTNSLGMEAVAEGVETQKQLDQLQLLGCRKFQGYLFSAPLSAEQLLSYEPMGTKLLPQEQKTC